MIWDALRPALEWLWGAFQVAAKGITDFFKPAVDAVGGALSWLGEQLGVTKGAQEAFAESTKQAGTATQEAVPQIQSFDAEMAKIPPVAADATTSIEGLGSATDSSMALMAGAVDQPIGKLGELGNASVSTKDLVVGNTEELADRVWANTLVIYRGLQYLLEGFEGVAGSLREIAADMHNSLDTAFKGIRDSANVNTTAVTNAFTTMKNAVNSQLVGIVSQINVTQDALVIFQQTAAVATSQIMTNFNALASIIMAALNSVRVQIAATNASMVHMAAVASSTTSQASAAFNALAAAGSSAMARLSSAVAANMASIQSSVNAAIARVNALQAAISGLQSKSITVTTNFHEVRTTEHRTVSSSSSSSSSGGGSRSNPFTGVAPATAAYFASRFRGQHGLDEVFNRPVIIEVAEGGRPEYVHVEPLTSAGIKAGGSLGGRGGGEIVLINIIEVDGVEVARAVRRHQMAGYSGLT
jgi:hypothetical protein